MLSEANVEKWSKLVALLNELAKFTAAGVLSVLLIAAVVWPEAVGNILAALELEKAEVVAGPIKIAVAKDTKKVAANTVQIADALTEAQTRLEELSAGLQQASSRNAYGSTLDATMKQIRLAQSALDQQSKSLESTAKTSGLVPTPPKTGWLYVGVFGDDGTLKFPSNRLEPKDGVRRSGKQFTGLVLRFDATIVADGYDCTKTHVSDFEPPAPKQQYAVLQASPEPIRVLSTRACPAPGGNQAIYAEIAVPNNRVRFASFSELPQ